MSDNTDIKDITESTTGGSRLGAAEQAQTDANKIIANDLQSYVPNDNDDLTTAANRDFVTGILRRIVGKADMNAYTDKDGNANEDGISRVKRALFALAYGDSSLVAKMAESTDDETRNVSKALINNAPKIAAMRLSMKRGNLRDYPVIDALNNAVKRFTALKQEGKPVDIYLQEMSMFSEYEDSEETREILKALNEFRRSSKKINAYLSRIVDRIRQTGDPNEEQLIESEPKTLDEILRGAKRDVVNGGQEDLFGANSGETKFSTLPKADSREEYEKLQNTTPIKVEEGIAQAGKESKGKGIQTAQAAFTKKYPGGVTVDTPIGKVTVNEQSIQDSLSHLPYPAKYDTVLSLPEGLEIAAYVDSVPDVNGKDIVNHFLVYPIEYKGNRRYVVCRVREKNGGRNLYIHGVYSDADIAKIKSQHLLQTPPPSKKEVNRGGADLYRQIIANFFNQDNSQKENKANRAERGGFSMGAFTAKKVNGKFIASLNVATQLTVNNRANVKTIAQNLGGQVTDGGYSFANEAKRDEFVRLANGFLAAASTEENAKFSITAWHGTPHDFDRFTLTAIGTGEGAQVHGYGLYFAGDREVSEEYKDRLSNSPSRSRIIIDGETFTNNDPGNIYFGWLDEDGDEIVDGDSLAIATLIRCEYSVDEAIESIEEERQHFDEETDYDSIRDYDEALDFLRDIKAPESLWEANMQQGRLYEVEIPDADVMLDEDLPFSEQPEKVQKILEPIINSKKFQDVATGGIAKMPPLSTLTGRTIYFTLSKMNGGIKQGAKAASEFLNKHGIKGITYVGEQDGRCYVVFDDNAIEIINKFSKNGTAQNALQNAKIVANDELSPLQQRIKEFAELLNCPLVFFKGKANLHGFMSNGAVYVNVASEINLPQVFNHEVFHWLKLNNEGLYNELLEHFAKEARFNKEQLGKWRDQTGRHDLNNREVIDSCVII